MRPPRQVVQVITRRYWHITRDEPGLGVFEDNSKERGDRLGEVANALSDALIYCVGTLHRQAGGIVVDA
jgi:hypothetical protein